MGEQSYWTGFRNGTLGLRIKLKKSRTLFIFILMITTTIFTKPHKRPNPFETQFEKTPIHKTRRNCIPSIVRAQSTQVQLQTIDTTQYASYHEINVNFTNISEQRVDHQLPRCRNLRMGIEPRGATDRMVERFVHSFLFYPLTTAPPFIESSVFVSVHGSIRGFLLDASMRGSRRN